MANQRYSEELLREAVDNAKSIAGVLRFLGVKQAGGAHAHISRRIKKFGIDTSHFTGATHNRGQAALNRLSPEQRLVVLPEGSPRTPGQRLLRALLSLGRKHSCDECGTGPVWNDRPLALHIDHIDGDFLNNQPGNLRILCPNCHTQTPTFAGRSAYRGSERRAQIRADPNRQPIASAALTALVQQVVHGEITAVRAAQIIGCAYSTIRRLRQQLETTGAVTLASPVGVGRSVRHTAAGKDQMAAIQR